MKNKKRFLLIGIALFIAGVVSAQSSRDVGTISAQSARFVGVDNCKDCHNRSEKGAQYDAWLKSPHSQAVRTLSSAKATEYASKNGISNAARDQRCLKCHSTYDAAPESSRTSDIKQTEGVSCESCHGAGSRYMTAAIMQDPNLAMRNGLIVPREHYCVRCHNPESPFYREFNYKVYFEKAKHSDPSREPRSESERFPFPERPSQ
jgi:nitrate/TMAO reductase-like tetraheme cytochrome c subunit